MRLILFFDLPSKTASERKKYNSFLKNIKKIGFYMLQESVYIKLTIDNQNANSVTKRVKDICPDKGSIIVLSITEQQFNKMNVLLGNLDTNIINNCDRFVVL